MIYLRAGEPGPRDGESQLVACRELKFALNGLTPFQILDTPGEMLTIDVLRSHCPLVARGQCPLCAWATRMTHTESLLWCYVMD